jgi:hypothetical protein
VSPRVSRVDAERTAAAGLGAAWGKRTARTAPPVDGGLGGLPPHGSLGGQTPYERLKQRTQAQV